MALSICYSLAIFQDVCQITLLHFNFCIWNGDRNTKFGQIVPNSVIFNISNLFTSICNVVAIFQDVCQTAMSHCNFGFPNGHTNTIFDQSVPNTVFFNILSHINVQLGCHLPRCLPNCNLKILFLHYKYCIGYSIFLCFVFHNSKLLHIIL